MSLTAHVVSEAVAHVDVQDVPRGLLQQLQRGDEALVLLHHVDLPGAVADEGAGDAAGAGANLHHRQALERLWQVGVVRLLVIRAEAGVSVKRIVKLIE